MRNVIIPFLTVICLIPTTGINVSADEILTQPSETTLYSVGIISSYSVGISGSGKSVLLNAKTYTSQTAKYVGLKNIVIQQSTNNNNWSDYITVDDLLAEDSTKYIASGKNIATVTGGYYYRVTCKHYAKESGLFGSSESISNTSNSIYIP